MGLENMENFEKSRLINTALQIQYQKAHDNAEDFAIEFNKLTQSDEDPL